jgi:ABC-type molybdate transport system permease subunit
MLICVVLTSSNILLNIFIFDYISSCTLPLPTPPTIIGLISISIFSVNDVLSRFANNSSLVCINCKRYMLRLEIN